MVIFNLFGEKQNILCSLTDDYYQLIERLKKKESDGCHLWIFCDLDSLPQERFRAFGLMSHLYQNENKNLVIILSNHSMPLFFTLYSLLPNAHWLLKSEDVKHIINFFYELFEKKENEYHLSHSLVGYVRNKLCERDLHSTISRNEWWLMEEIFKGKSLSQISYEVDVDVRRLSHIKRHLMKRLNIKNNIELFEVFKSMLP